MTLLEQIVAETTARTMTESSRLAIEKVAVELAQDALKDEEFRKSFHEMIRRYARATWEQLQQDHPAP
jgi:hypothetical protein